MLNIRTSSFVFVKDFVVYSWIGLNVKQKVLVDTFKVSQASTASKVILFMLHVLCKNKSALCTCRVVSLFWIYYGILQFWWAGVSPVTWWAHAWWMYFLPRSILIAELKTTTTATAFPPLLIHTLTNTNIVSGKPKLIEMIFTGAWCKEQV